MEKNKTYLVLGANGFVGSYLVEHLARLNGSTVIAFDRFSREPDFIVSDNVKVFKGDILSDDDISNALEGVDYVMHSYSATTPFTSDNDPYIDITNNLSRGVDIFRLSVEHGVKKIGFISTGGAVYGIATEKGIVTEDTMPLPVSPYGINKLAIEHYLEYFKRKYDLDYTVYRLTNPYGPRQRSNKNQGVIPIFLNKIIADEKITVFGDGSATRDYIYMDDAARMIVETFESENKYNIYNIGSGEQKSLKDILETIKKTLNKTDILVEYKQSPATFLKSTAVSIERFTSEFEIPNLTTFENGIRKTVDSL